MPHLCSLLKPSALPDRRHQPLIIGSAVAPALRCHAAAGKTRRRLRPVRRRPQPEDLMGRPQSAGLARWSGGWARLAAWEASIAAAREWYHSRPNAGGVTWAFNKQQSLYLSPSRPRRQRANAVMGSAGAERAGRRRDGGPPSSTPPAGPQLTDKGDLTLSSSRSPNSHPLWQVGVRVEAVGRGRGEGALRLDGATAPGSSPAGTG